MEYLNNNSWGISFTPTFSATEIKFSDLLISHKTTSPHQHTLNRSTPIVFWSSRMVITKHGNEMSPLDNFIVYIKIALKMRLSRPKLKSSDSASKIKAIQKAL